MDTPHFHPGFHQGPIQTATAPDLAGMAHFRDATEMVAALKPENPVYCIRPHVLHGAARRFLDLFPGRVLYAVKCNAEPSFIDALHEAGIRDFDTASLAEIALIRERYPEARAYYMHPVKQRGSIRLAYGRYGIRHFAVDHPDELAKVQEETGGARDLVIIVRLATARGAAVYDLGGKFGLSPEKGAELLARAHGEGYRVGVTFHVGSQCLTPSSYTAALRLVAEALRLAPVPLSVLDVGGGFPAAYVGLAPPPLESYVDAIQDGLAILDLPPECEIWCEPGRALVAGGASLVVRVELRRDNFLFINDGVYGSLSDLKYAGLTFPMRVIRPAGKPSDTTAEFSLFGPTCDSADVMEGPYCLAEDVREGDYIEIGQAGAYTLELRTDFNGFFPDRFVVVTDPEFLPTPQMEPAPITRAAE